MNKLLPLLALAPLAIGTPALASLDSQYHTDRQEAHMRATHCHEVKEKVQWQWNNEISPDGNPLTPENDSGTQTNGYYIDPNDAAGMVVWVSGTHRNCEINVAGYLNKEYVNNEMWLGATVLFKYENGSLVRYRQGSSGGQIRRNVYKPFTYRGNNSNEYRLDNACKNWSYNNPAVEPFEKQSEYNRCRKGMGPAFHLPGRASVSSTSQKTLWGTSSNIKFVF